MHYDTGDSMSVMKARKENIVMITESVTPKMKLIACLTETVTL